MNKRAGLLSLALYAVIVGPAFAVLPPCAYDELVDAAPVAVHMTVSTVAAPDARGDCLVAGRVDAVLRGNVVPGTLLTVAVPCTNPDMAVGGTLYTSPEALAAARALELYLDTGGTIAAYGAGIEIIPAADGKPHRVPMCDE